MQRRGFSRRPASETHTVSRTRTLSRDNIQEKEGEWETRMKRKRGEGDEGGGAERKGEVGRIAVYLHASRYNTSELMPPTHRRHLRGLSYGGYF